MSWLAPTGLAFLGLLLPLVLLYVLRPRRALRVVSSTLLWQAVARERSAERPFQRLVARASLLLQAAVLLLGAFALGRPACRGDDGYGGRLAIVIDASTSMRAEAAGRARLEEAREIAHARIDALGSTAEATIVEAGRTPRLVLPLTRDVRALHRAVDALVARGGGADLGAAVTLARDRLRGAGRIVVITDGAFDGDVSVPASGIDAEVVRVGAAADNVALVGADATVTEEEETQLRLGVFARVASFARRTREVTVRVEGEDGRTLAARRVGLPAGESTVASLTFPLPSDALDRFFLVRLVDREGAPLGDALPLDDVRAIRAPLVRELPVVVVDDVPEPVVRALRADPRTSLFVSARADLATVLARPELAHALVVVRGALPEAAQRHDVLVLDATSVESLGLTRGEAGVSSRWLRVANEDETMRFVAPTVWGASALAPLGGDGAIPLLVTDRGAAIVRVERDGRSWVLTGFDPARSLWPRDPSFVVFLHDVVASAIRRVGVRAVPDGCLGEPIRVPHGDATFVPTVRLPRRDGAPDAAAGPSRLVGASHPTDRVGVYLVDHGEGASPVLRVACDAGESDLAPRGSVELVRDEARASTLAEGLRPDLVDLGPYLALAALLVVVVESLHGTRQVRR